MFHVIIENMFLKEVNRDTLNVRVISSAFVAIALAIFTPFGLSAGHWESYLHLIPIWLMGVVVCFLSDIILGFILRMPSSNERGVAYIIRRNLWFQIINTPLVALVLCLYRHFVLSGMDESNKLSWSNFFETLLIIAFCSFAIGLYWRFKFRSKYLQAELEEVRQMNEQLQKSQQEYNTAESFAQWEKSKIPDNETLTLAGTTSEMVTLRLANLLYIESVGNYAKVCYLRDGNPRTDMLRTTSKQMEETLKDYPLIVRCHRAFLVNLANVEHVISHSGTMQLQMKHNHDILPVSRSNMAQVKAVLKGF